jgi:hypothetical protein
LNSGCCSIALILHAPISHGLKERDELMKSADVDERLHSDIKGRSLVLQHPFRDLQRSLIDDDRYSAVSESSIAENVERAAGQRVKSVVNDDAQTYGVMIC